MVTKHVTICTPSGIYSFRQAETYKYIKLCSYRIDQDRLKEVGPDRCCAEWILRCGGSIRWKGKQFWEKDYNSLPPTNMAYKVEEIDATGSSVMAVGFIHLRMLPLTSSV
jgi:H+-transporting ATP synthase F0 complex subunit s